MAPRAQAKPARAASASAKGKPAAKPKAAAAKSRTKAPGTAKANAKPRPRKPAASDALPGPNPLFRSLRTAIYHVPDLARAKAFYTPALGRDPYFDQSFYVGYDVDGFELGLDPDTSRRAPGPGGVVAYWRVDDVRATLTHLILLGATTIEAPHDVGEHIQVAIAGDPFGNSLGLIQLDA